MLRLSRPVVSSISLAVLCAAMAMSHAAWALTTAEASDLLRAGGRVTLDHSFALPDLQAMAKLGGDRFTVECDGISSADALALVASGCRAIVHNAYGSAQVLKLCQTGRGRVFVDAKGFAASDIDAYRKLGAIVIDGNGGATVADKMRTLQLGYYIAVDKSVAAQDIRRLAAVGGWRVAVICHGFSLQDVQTFVAAGAMVWLDASMQAKDVVNTCAIARDRGVVLAKGFAYGDLLQVAHAGSHVVLLTASSTLVRAALFNILDAGQ